jgi:acyl-CoA synthetase (AMP-forming)/AMP-acid ligase II
LQRLNEVLPNTKCVQTYGLSELGVLRSKSRPDGSLWISFSHEGFETQIREGVLWVRTPAAMLGYLNAPDLFDADGWLNTQDAVEVDGEWLRVLGRVSDLINVGGQKVYPAEVEEVLGEHPGVAEVGVIGVPHPHHGEAVKAFVVPKHGIHLDEEQIIEWCSGHLARYKCPTKVLFVDQLPRNVSGKLLRRSLV